MTSENKATNRPVRVRFAPSPTGYLHVGGVRTAMYNWLFARHSGGVFILRIEDTDVARRVEGAVESFTDGLTWLGMDWDEGPYFQSDRLEGYQRAAEKLVAQGDAYYCYCSPERLSEMREDQQQRKQPPGYDRLCRSLTPDECAANDANGIGRVVRFKMPLEGQITHNDIVYGEVTFDLSTLDDFVLLKSDGYPTYHLANVVDDTAMEISHVIRGEEWISSVPRHLLLYKALELEPPRYAHHPLLRGPGGAKLSKRHGDVALKSYADAGYLPEAMFNFIGMIGWSLDDKTELITKQELIDNFSLERITKTGALFDKTKLEWMNGVYIRGLSVEDFTQRALPFLDKGLPPEVPRPLSADYVAKIAPLIQERARTLVEVPELTSYFFTDESGYDPERLISKKMTREQAVQALEVSRERLAGLSAFDAEALEDLLRPLADDLGLKTGQLFGTLRVATTGRTAAPPLFHTMEVLGKDVCLRRIDSALGKLRG